MTTVVDALASRLSSATAHNHATEKPPAIVLWTDGEAKWRPALPTLRKRFPNLWTLGPYDPAVNQGPAPWVKWKLGKVVAGDPIPVLYLPGVQRLQFRALEDFPDELRPIAELQFLGTWWTQTNGKDWTPLAFLSAKKGGLGLAVAEDAETVAALERLVGRVLEAPVADLKKPSRLEAEHFVALLTDDLEDDILTWLEAPANAVANYTPEEWGVFRDFVKKRLDVDLDRDGALVAAEQLVQRKGGWAKVWSRYASAVPASYGGVHLVLENANPSALMFDKSTLPRHNNEQEQTLRAALDAVGQLPEAKARASVRALEAEHGLRRGWVWARLGKAHLATALQHLVALADATEPPVGGVDLVGLASWYTATGHKADAAALASMALADHADGPAILAAVRALYLPWLQRVAERLRDLGAAGGYPAPTPVPLEEGTCLLFADGLRWDVGALLGARLTSKGRTVETEGRWVTFPPVTGTSKPDVSPIRDLLTGGDGASDFAPSAKASGKALDSATFRKLLTDAGVQVLQGSEKGQPTGRAWTEFGDLDKYGHEHGCKTARHVEGQVGELEQRVAELLDAGWKRVRVTTDHGWLLVPGGLPVVKVPPGLAESRWGRCAVLKLTSKSDLPTLPWAWNPAVDVTYAPGVCAFYAGKEYAHGGLTVQECYAPVLTVTSGQTVVDGKLGDVKWVGLRCRATVKTTTAGLRFDLRSKVADASTSLLDASKTFGADGTVSVLVPDDRLEGTAAFAVLLAPDGAVIDKRPTTIGEDA